MKHGVTLLAMMFASVFSYAEYELNAEWGKALTAENNTTQISDIVANDSVVFVSATCMSMTEEETLRLGGEPVATGTATTSTSGNAVFVMTCIGKAGDLRWSVYSKGGEAATNDMYMSPTADGGVVVAFGLRHAKVDPVSDIALVDGKGKETPIEWTVANSNSRYYRLVVLKATAEGEIEWLRMAAVDYAPVTEKQTVAGQGFGVKSVLATAEGDIYVAGRQQKAIKMATSATDSLEWQPMFVDGWNGTSTSVGGMFIAKLDAEGYVKKVLQMSGSAKESNVLDMKESEGAIYAMGTLTFAEETEVKLGDIAVSYAGENSLNQAITVAKLSKELEVEDFWYYPSNLSGSVVNYSDMSIDGDDIYLMGKMKYGMAAEGSESITTGELVRDGLVFRVSKKDGSVKGGRAAGTLQSGYAGIYNGVENTYLFMQTSIGGPYKMEVYGDNNLSEPTAVETLFESASDIKGVVEIETEEGTLLVMAARAGNKKNTLYGGEISVGIESGKFSGVLAAITLKETAVQGGDEPEKPTTVETLKAVAEDAVVYDLTGRYAGKMSEVGQLKRGLYVAGGRIISVK